MKRVVLTAAVVLGLGVLCASAGAQVVTVYSPVVGYPAPVTTYYAPAPVPYSAYYAPAPVPYTAYYGAPAVAFYRGPAVVPPRYVYPGQPVRNFFRGPRVVW